MYDNSLSGQLPSELGLLTRLRSMEFGSNKLTGTIPTTLAAIQALVLNLEDNQIKK